MEEDMIRVEKLSYCFPKHFSLSDISFSLAVGELVSILGPNGSGKTTLLKLVAGLLSEGQNQIQNKIFYQGQDLYRFSPSARAQVLAYVPAESIIPFALKVSDAVAMGFEVQRSGWFRTSKKELEEKVSWALEETGAVAFRDRNLQELSSGERQLVAIARALVQGARVFLLDEAISHLDISQRRIWGERFQQWKKKGWSLILVTHDLNFAFEYTDRYLLLKKGQAMACAQTQEAIDPALLERVFPGCGELGKNPKTQANHLF